MHVDHPRDVPERQRVAHEPGAVAHVPVHLGERLVHGSHRARDRRPRRRRAVAHADRPEDELVRQGPEGPLDRVLPRDPLPHLHQVVLGGRPERRIREPLVEILHDVARLDDDRAVIDERGHHAVRVHSPIRVGAMLGLREVEVMVRPAEALFGEHHPDLLRAVRQTVVIEVQSLETACLLPHQWTHDLHESPPLQRPLNGQAIS
jgi:hypothetical protein